MSSIHLQIGFLVPLLLWASVCDLKTRQIPNAVPFAILFLGLIHFSPFFSFAGLVCTGLPIGLALYAQAERLVAATLN